MLPVHGGLLLSTPEGKQPLRHCQLCGQSHVTPELPEGTRAKVKLCKDTWMSSRAVNNSEMICPVLLEGTVGLVEFALPGEQLGGKVRRKQNCTPHCTFWSVCVPKNARQQNPKSSKQNQQQLPRSRWQCVGLPSGLRCGAARAEAGPKRGVQRCRFLGSRGRAATCNFPPAHTTPIVGGA